MKILGSVRSQCARLCLTEKNKHRILIQLQLFAKCCLIHTKIDLPTKIIRFEVSYKSRYGEVYQSPRHQEKSYVKIHLVGINHAVKTFGSESDRKNRNWKCSSFLTVPLIPFFPDLRANPSNPQRDSDISYQWRYRRCFFRLWSLRNVIFHAVCI